MATMPAEAALARGHLERLLAGRVRVLSLCPDGTDHLLRFADETHVRVSCGGRGREALLAVASVLGLVRLEALDRGDPTVLLLTVADRTLPVTARGLVVWPTASGLALAR